MERLATHVLAARVLAAALAAAPLAAPAFAQTVSGEVAAPAGRITVIGEGTASLKPDIARLDLGVIEEAPSAEEALSRVAERLQAALEVLREAGLAPADIRTQRIDLSPVYDYTDEGRQPPVRFQAASTLELTIRDLDTLGDVLDASTQAGANTIGAFRFEATGSDVARDEARRLAVADAAGKAALYAEAAGVDLGALLSLTEAFDTGGPVPLMAEARMMDAAATMPVAPGEIEVTASVTLVYGF